MSRTSFVLVALLMTAMVSPMLAEMIVYQAGPTGPVWTINLGSASVAVALLVGFWKLLRVLGQFHKDYLRIVSDVEVLMLDYCERKGIERAEVPQYMARRQQAIADGGGD